MSKKVWNLMYVAGNPELFKRITTAADNPRARAVALADAEHVARNGWRVWVEHADTGERIFQSKEEIAFQHRSGADRAGVAG
ncbi:hypothetical protein [Burkholderia gladioli]|uniref:hypothetical protein n=1 Tax=Burkholderia gladioli TaxID=28095 RepID=UPI00163EAD04|nr:hypothetical protein [Burkholderia gladioli]